jgi:CHASE3 domain sensor protein
MIDAYQPTGKPLPPDKNWYNMPLIRSFFQDPKSRGTVVQFYELDRHVRQAVNSFAEAEKQGDAEKMQEIVEERASLLGLEDTMKDIRNDLKEIRQQKNQILRSAIDPSRKRELLNIIREQELAITATMPILRQIGYQ